MTAKGIFFSFFNKHTSTNFHQTKCEIKATYDIFQSEWIVKIKRKTIKSHIKCIFKG